VIQGESKVIVIYGTASTVDRGFAPRNFEIGYLGGLGLRIKKWNLEARYEHSSGISDFLNEGSTIVRYYFLMRYRLYN
jgi:hypothetical protein